MTAKKIVLITGANKGIGFATAAALAQDGHTVLLGARDPGRGEAAATTLTSRALDARFIHLDVTDPATITSAAKLIEADYGRLDVLVNNAAITRDQSRPPGEMPVTDVREIYETNVFGVIAVTNAMLPLLRRSESGYIGNVSSGLGTFALLSNPGKELAQYATLLGYNSSKAALNAITLIYANALRDSGIRVNALSPGFCATDLNGHTGTLSADEGGAHIARQTSAPETGVFLNETAGTYPW
ncbi:SDR family NAD(P)-dependent oxidoreductase [Actinomadura bangladeshensis]|uniref:SDR family NAD(P)-dependent oxidoreductase n=1 Tax=Actinomadura bangladeshensis TaxID=453573 RepID=A0A6L9Q7C2_9ACTN|nr:SDR family NAD(P)-dependent oxidoreductase [Actinomadura bangladeshensis]NEA20922.1 SDR family NAD(P)-dependent oxidoreductase [Actinomadura bangladeshensis]